MSPVNDATYLSIAAASVLAKNYRDELMGKLSETFPGYGWLTNVGYPTEEHRDGIRQLGITPYSQKILSISTLTTGIVLKFEELF